MGSRPSVDIILKPCVILSDNSTRALRLSATQAIFHEGSKGYLCCKRRVLEFAEFLKIEGCTTGTHLFVGSKKDKVDLRFRPGKFKLMLARLRRKLCLVGWTIIRHRCRCMSRHSRKGERELYALSRAPLNPRRADKERSKVVFEPQQVRSGRPLKINPVLRRIDYHCAPLLTLAQLRLDLFLPANKRVIMSVTLYGPIDPSTSTFRILSTKVRQSSIDTDAAQVEIVLQKSSASSWPLLELPPAGSELPPGYALTFGVSGRTGTIGGKEIVLSPEEMARR